MQRADTLNQQILIGLIVNSARLTSAAMLVGFAEDQRKIHSSTRLSFGAVLPLPADAGIVFSCSSQKTQQSVLNGCKLEQTDPTVGIILDVNSRVMNTHTSMDVGTYTVSLAAECTHRACHDSPWHKIKKNLV